MPWATAIAGKLRLSTAIVGFPRRRPAALGKRSSKLLKELEARAGFPCLSLVLSAVLRDESAEVAELSRPGEAS